MNQDHKFDPHYNKEDSKKILPLCPYCLENVWRDSVDVGVGIMYGPWGCGNCRWSSDPYYDKRNGDSIEQLNFPDDLVDQWGGLYPNWRKNENRSSSRTADK